MFCVSVFLVLLSSYFILSCISPKEKNISAFLYIILISFSQVVLSFEVLSLFGLISKNNFFICNIVFMILSVGLMIKTKSKLYLFNFDINKIVSAIRQDKTLLFLSICFIVFMISQLIVAVFFPVTFGDALNYYLTRCTDWIQQGSINHFITPDTRELVMPVNMELLYLWKLLFTKNETAIAVFSYISYLGLIYIIYNLLKEINFTVRQRLWSIFVLSSFALIAVEMYTPCADMFIGALILGGIYLYIKSVKYENKLALYFSSLAFALSAGTKTTAIIAIPSVLFILITITYVYRKGNIKKYFLLFSLYFFINFLIFASYNYILNIIQFLNPITSSEQMELNRFRGGFKGYISNIIKYSFAIFDTSGIKDYINFNGFITYIQSLTLGLFGITDRMYTSNFFLRYFKFDEKMSMMNSLLGFMGLFVFLPSLIKSLKRFFKHKTRQSIITGILALSLIFNILLFSRIMVFTGYNMRYILTFIIIAVPIIAYSYISKNKIFKYLLCFIMFIYLVIIAHHKPVSFIFSYINHQIKSPNSAFILLKKSDEINIYNFLKLKKPKNIALILEHVNTPNYFIEKIKLDGIKADKILLENIEEYDLSKYEYIITNKEKSSSTNIVNFEDKIKYPQIYVTKCIYYDYVQNEIESINSNKPAMVSCEIPYEYFAYRGFSEVKDINAENYTIFEKSHTKI